MTYLSIFIVLLGIIAAVHAIFRARTPQGASAWAISLLAFPWIAVPLYLVFGRRTFNSYLEALRSARAEHRQRVQEIIAGILQHAREPEGTRAETIKFLETVADLPFTGGNDVQLLVNGKDTFQSLLADINAAQSYILIQFYIVRDDLIGREVQAALIVAAQRGVRVYFLYDEIGSWQLPSSYFRVLQEAGCEVSAFRTTQGRKNLLQFNFRNHRKTTVIDGAIGYLGGINLGDEYLRETKRFGVWRDTHLRVRGPTVQVLQLVFVVDWYWATRNFIEVHSTSVREPSDKQLLLLSTAPITEHDQSILFFIEMIDAAASRVWIASPYFTPDSAICAVLRRAALRQVDVRILLPAKGDHLAVWLASFTFLPELLDAGVKVYMYQPGFMHQKALLVDDDLVSIGTINLDNRSLRLNFEQTLVIHDKPFAKEVEGMLEQDFSRSTLLTTADILKRSKLSQFGSRLARLFEPIL